MTIDILDASPSHLFGEIKLVITSIAKPTKKEEKLHIIEPGSMSLPSQKVHERSKKGITHRVK